MHNFLNRFKENARSYFYLYVIIFLRVLDSLVTFQKSNLKGFYVSVLDGLALSLMTYMFCSVNALLKTKERQLSNEVDPHFGTFEEFNSVLEQISNVLDDRDSELEELNRKLIVSPKFKYLKYKKFINCRWKV